MIIGSSEPPWCITGVLGPTWSLDWLAYTLPGEVPPDEAVPWVPAGGWVDRDRGLLGYTRAQQAGHALLCTRGTEQMGTHVVLAGTAVREAEAIWGAPEWRGVIAYVQAYGGSVTRMDVAVDCDDARLTVAGIEEQWHRGYATTRASHLAHGFTETVLGGARRETGLTIGQRGSGTYVRIYDWVAAHVPAGVPTQPDGTAWPAHRTRVEYEYRADRADVVAGVYANEGQHRLAAGMMAHLQFRQPRPTDGHVKRWPASPWWDDMMGHVAARPIWRARRVRSLWEAERWLERAVSATLATALHGHDGDLDYLQWLAALGSQRMRARHWAMLAAAA